MTAVTRPRTMLAAACFSLWFWHAGAEPEDGRPRTDNLVGGHAEVQGHVFLDANGNARRDQGEKPFPGVFVSDGERIIKSGADGSFRFSIDLEVPTRIFVTQPTGYRIVGPFSHLVSPGEQTVAFALREQGSDPLRLAWIHSTGNELFHFGAPIIHNGSVLWKREVHEGDDKNRGFRWNMTLAPLRADTERVYAAAVNTRKLLSIFCADAATGEKLWSRTAGTRHGRATQTAGVAVHGPRLYYENHVSCGALDAVTGEDVWMEEEKRTRGEASPAVSGEFAYFHRPGVLRKRNAGDGALVWEHEIPGAMNYVGMPAVGDGRVIVASANKLYALDDEAGTRLWTFVTPAPGGLAGARHQNIRNGAQPVIDGPYVYIGSDNGIFYVLDAGTGKPVWEYNTGVPIKGAAAKSDRFLVCSAFDGNIYAFRRK